MSCNWPPVQNSVSKGLLSKVNYISFILIYCTNQIETSTSPPWATPRHLNIGKFLFKSLLPGPKSCSNAPTPRLLSNFYYASETVYETWFIRQHPLYMPRDSGHISCKHIKSNIVDELTITPRVAAKKREFIVGFTLFQQHLNTFHTFIPLFIHKQ